MRGDVEDELRVEVVVEEIAMEENEDWEVSLLKRSGYEKWFWWWCRE